jgi:hypothetical protein
MYFAHIVGLSVIHQVPSRYAAASSIAISRLRPAVATVRPEITMRLIAVHFFAMALTVA